VQAPAAQALKLVVVGALSTRPDLTQRRVHQRVLKGIAKGPHDVGMQPVALVVLPGEYGPVAAKNDDEDRWEQERRSWLLQVCRYERDECHAHRYDSASHSFTLSLVLARLLGVFLVHLEVRELFRRHLGSLVACQRCRSPAADRATEGREARRQVEPLVRRPLFSVKAPEHLLDLVD